MSTLTAALKNLTLLIVRVLLSVARRITSVGRSVWRRIVSETGVLTLLVLASAVWLGFAVWTAYDNRQEHQIAIAAGSGTSESYALAQALKTVTTRHYPRIRITVLEIEGATGLLEEGVVQLVAVPSDTPVGPSARSVAALTPQSLLLARSDVDNRVVYALTQTLLQRGPELADALTNAAFRPLAANVQKPDVTSTSAAPLHPGATAFYEWDKTPFVRRYSRLIAIVAAGLVLLGLWTGRWIHRMWRRRKMLRKKEERSFAELAARVPWSFSRLLLESTREVAPAVAATPKRWQMPVRPTHRGAARPIDRQLL